MESLLSGVLPFPPKDVPAGAAVAADAHHVVTTTDRFVVLRSGATGAVAHSFLAEDAVASLAIHTAPVTLAPTVAGGSATRGAVHLWHPAAGSSSTAVLPSALAAVRCVCFTDYGRRLVVLQQDGTVAAVSGWADVGDSLPKVSSITSPMASPRTLRPSAVSPDLYVVGCSDGQWSAFDTTPYVALRTTGFRSSHDSNDAIVAADWDPHHQELLLVATPRSVRLHDVDLGVELCPALLTTDPVAPIVDLIAPPAAASTWAVEGGVVCFTRTAAHDIVAWCGDVSLDDQGQPPALEAWATKLHVGHGAVSRTPASAVLATGTAPAAAARFAVLYTDGTVATMTFFVGPNLWTVDTVAAPVPAPAHLAMCGPAQVHGATKQGALLWYDADPALRAVALLRATIAGAAIDATCVVEAAGRAWVWAAVSKDQGPDRHTQLVCVDTARRQIAGVARNSARPAPSAVRTVAAAGPLLLLLFTQGNWEVWATKAEADGNATAALVHANAGRHVLNACWGPAGTVFCSAWPGDRVLTVAKESGRVSFYECTPSFVRELDGLGVQRSTAEAADTKVAASDQWLLCSEAGCDVQLVLAQRDHFSDSGEAAAVIEAFAGSARRALVETMDIHGDSVLLAYANGQFALWHAAARHAVYRSQTTDPLGQAAGPMLLTGPTTAVVCLGRGALVKVHFAAPSAVDQCGTARPMALPTSAAHRLALSVVGEQSSTLPAAVVTAFTYLAAPEAVLVCDPDGATRDAAATAVDEQERHTARNAHLHGLRLAALRPGHCRAGVVARTAAAFGRHMAPPVVPPPSVDDDAIALLLGSPPDDPHFPIAAALAVALAAGHGSPHTAVVAKQAAAGLRSARRVPMAVGLLAAVGDVTGACEALLQEGRWLDAARVAGSHGLVEERRHALVLRAKAVATAAPAQAARLVAAAGDTAAAFLLLCASPDTVAAAVAVGCRLLAEVPDPSVDVTSLVQQWARPLVLDTAPVPLVELVRVALLNWAAFLAHRQHSADAAEAERAAAALQS